MSKIGATVDYSLRKDGTYILSREGRYEVALAFPKEAIGGWNVEVDGNTIRFCRGNHDHHESCDWEYIPRSVNVEGRS